jgi:hypothetical protein
MSFRFTRGPKFLVDALNRVLDEEEAHHVVPGRNIRPTQGITGILLDVIIPPSSSVPPHPWLPIDASSQLSGTAPAVSITTASLIDMTHGGTTWVGTTGSYIIYLADYLAGSVPFALTITGPPARQPALQLDPAATVVYLQCTVSSSTGFITASAIMGDSGAGVPASTSTQFNTLLSSVMINSTMGGAPYSVSVFNNGPQSSLFFAICGLLPLTSGDSYRAGT